MRYMTDGGMPGLPAHRRRRCLDQERVIRPLIVVGLQTRSCAAICRARPSSPRSGGRTEGGRRRQLPAFFRDELTLIAQRYRTTAESAVIGESLAGLFAVETLLVEPALFDSYIAADPSLWWNEQALVRTVASTKLAWWTAGPKQLYIATADHPPMLEAVAVLEQLLRIYAPPITWQREEMPDEHHGSIFPRAALRGIRWAFATP